MIKAGIVRVPDGRLADEDAWDIAMMMVRLGEAVPPWKWVEDLIAEANADSLKVLF